MKIKIIFSVMFLLFVFILPVGVTLAADVEGSSDHRLFKRYEGSEIIKYEFHEYDSLTIPLGKAKSSTELSKSMHAEGVVIRKTEGGKAKNRRVTLVQDSQ